MRGLDFTGYPYGQAPNIPSKYEFQLYDRSRLNFYQFWKGGGGITHILGKKNIAEKILAQLHNPEKKIQHSTLNQIVKKKSVQTRMHVRMSLS